MIQFIIEIFSDCYTIENYAGIRYYWYEFLNGLIFVCYANFAQIYSNECFQNDATRICRNKSTQHFRTNPLSIPSL